MHFDGSKLLHGSGAGVTLKSPKGDELSYVLQIHFPTTNNIAEYEALLHELRVTKEIGVKHIICCSAGGWYIQGPEQDHGSLQR
jgi:ribonuclease HI